MNRSAAPASVDKLNSYIDSNKELLSTAIPHLSKACVRYQSKINELADSGARVADELIKVGNRAGLSNPWASVFLLMAAQQQEFHATLTAYAKQLGEQVVAALNASTEQELRTFNASTQRMRASNVRFGNTITKVAGVISRKKTPDVVKATQLLNDTSKEVEAMRGDMIDEMAFLERNIFRSVFMTWKVFLEQQSEHEQRATALLQQRQPEWQRHSNTLPEELPQHKAAQHWDIWDADAVDKKIDELTAVVTEEVVGGNDAASGGTSGGGGGGSHLGIGGASGRRSVVGLSPSRFDDDNKRKSEPGNLLKKGVRAFETLRGGLKTHTQATGGIDRPPSPSPSPSPSTSAVSAAVGMSHASPHAPHAGDNSAAASAASAVVASGEPVLAYKRAVYDYTPGAEGELALTAGALVEVLKWDDSDWWQGRCLGVDGFFPAIYVEDAPASMIPAERPASPLLHRPPSDARPPKPRSFPPASSSAGSTSSPASDCDSSSGSDKRSSFVNVSVIVEPPASPASVSAASAAAETAADAVAGVWLTDQTEDGQTYYYHSITNETSWEKPA